MKTLLILLLFTGNAFALSHDAGQSVAGFESTYVNVTGDTMTGQLNVSSNVIVTSSVTAISFFGEGSNITDLDPTEITAGALDSDVIISSIAIGAIDHENQITDDLIINADINSAAGIAATKLADGTVTSAELQYINSLASNAQTQLDGITASTGTNATDIANIKISTGANKVLIDANTTQLTQVATDTTTISGIATTNQSQLTQVAVDTTTIYGMVTSNDTDIANLVTDTTTISGIATDNQTQLTQVAADTTTISGIATDNQTQLTQVAVDTTTLQTNIDGKASLADVNTFVSSQTISNNLGVTGNITGVNIYASGSSTHTGVTTLSGNVGIGRSPTTNKLEVSGVVKIAIDSQSGTLVFGDAGSSLEYNGIWRGLGNSKTVGNHLNIQGYNGVHIMEGSAAFGSATEVLTVYDNGNVGISTTTPSYKLDVNGTLHATGAVTLDSNITIGGYTQLYSRSIAQLQAITPTVVGQTYFCNNCSPTKIVVSTGTAQGNFANAVGGAFE